MYKAFLKLSKSYWGRVILSFLIGFGIASILRGRCEEDDCITLEAPDPSLIDGKAYSIGDRCYTFEPRIVPCASKSPVRVSNR